MDKEYKRHKKVMKLITDAKTKSELPRVTFNNLLRYFADNLHFGEKLSTSSFEPVLDVFDSSNVINPEVRELLIKILKDNFPGHSDSEYFEKFYDLNRIKIKNIADEIETRKTKYFDFEMKEDLEKHKKILNDINSAYDLKSIPLVTKSTLNSYICNVSKSTLPVSFKVADISHISDKLIDGKEVASTEIYKDFYDAFEKLDYPYEKGFEEFYNRLVSNDRIKYIVEEINARKDRVEFIYKNYHNEVMENIKDANRISELPQNLSFSSLSNYLSGNTIIYKNGSRISSSNLSFLTQLLLDGKTFSDDEVRYEIRTLANENFPLDVDEAFHLLYDKLSSLPRTYYLVEEINESKKRQEEFIGRGTSNVNVYYIPNPNSPEYGGLFYTCYINRAELDLTGLIPSPLELDKLVPDDLSKDALEWYIQDKYDPTFKAAGGIILNRDESIGSINIFTPFDTNNVQISAKEHSKFKEIEAIAKQVKDVVHRKKEEKEVFSKLYDDFLKRQDESDRVLAELEAKLDALTSLDVSDKGSRGGR